MYPDMRSVIEGMGEPDPVTVTRKTLPTGISQVSATSAVYDADATAVNVRGLIPGSAHSISLAVQERHVPDRENPTLAEPPLASSLSTW